MNDFERKLLNANWGEEELKKIEVPEEAEEIEMVMDALQNRLGEIGMQLSQGGDN